jgi:hypothetical protein
MTDARERLQSELQHITEERLKNLLDALISLLKACSK